MNERDDEIGVSPLKSMMEDLLTDRPERKNEMGGFDEYIHGPTEPSKPKRKIDDYPPKDAVKNEDEGRDWLSMYQDVMNDLLRTCIENQRLEKQNEELEERVKSLQQGALHAENKRLRAELKIMDEMGRKILWAIDGAREA